MFDTKSFVQYTIVNFANNAKKPREMRKKEKYDALTSKENDERIDNLDLIVSDFSSGTVDEFQYLISVIIVNSESY